jgi:hypothetical protein
VVTRSDMSGVHAFASGSKNIVIVNTLSSAILASIALRGVSPGSVELWQSTATRGAPHRAGSRPHVNGRVPVPLPAFSVKTVIVR